MVALFDAQSKESIVPCTVRISGVWRAGVSEYLHQKDSADSLEDSARGWPIRWTISVSNVFDYLWEERTPAIAGINDRDLHRDHFSGTIVPVCNGEPMSTAVAEVD